MAKSARGGNQADFDALTGILERMPIDEALPVARAFSHFLTLANIAEQHHRIRRRRVYERDPKAPPQIGSCDETLGRLRRAGMSGRRAPRRCRAGCEIELVFTAHPTEVTRRTLMQKHRRIADAARVARPARSHDARSGGTRSTRCASRLPPRGRRARSGASGRLRSTRRASGLVVFEQTLWDALAALSACAGRRARDRIPGAACRSTRRRSASARGSAAIATATRRDRGRDRDGVPARAVAGGELYLREIDALRYELSMTMPSDELRARAGDADEPYRDAAARRARAAGRDAARASKRWLDGHADAPARRSSSRRRISPSRCASATARSIETGQRRDWPAGGCAICCGASRPSARRWCASTCGRTRRATRRR